MSVLVFFFIDTATTEAYTYSHTLSLPDAPPILNLPGVLRRSGLAGPIPVGGGIQLGQKQIAIDRSVDPGRQRQFIHQGTEQPLEPIAPGDQLLSPIIGPFPKIVPHRRGARNSIV